MTTHKKNVSPMSDVSVSTDQQDYAPGSTATITASGFAAGSTVTFQVQHVTDAGPDGIWGTPDDVIEITTGAGHDPWSVTDGGPGDLDGEVNGSITTSWYVNPDDSEGATFLLTAASGEVMATASFTDSPLVVATGVTVTEDETAGLQNATATPSPAGDADDNDILLTALPTAFSGRLTTLGAGTATGAALSGYTGAVGNTGSNAFTINAAPGGTVQDVSFTDSLGAALNGLDSGLQTLDGTHILLYTDTTDNNILVGRAGSSSGTIVFAAYIEQLPPTPQQPAGGKIWMVEYQPFKHPDATNPDDAVNLLNKVFIGVSQDLTFSLANAPSGQNLFLMFTTENPSTFTDASNVVRISSPTIIATGKDPADQSSGANITTGDTINTSQAGGPTTFGTNNQMIVEQEGIRFTFVTGARQDLTIPNLDQNEADLESNIDFTAMFGARSASFDVVQLQSGKSAVVKISAFSTAAETGVNFINGYTGDTAVTITSVKVVNISTGATVTDPSLVISINGGVATVTGVLAGYRIEYTTSQDHNRVLVENGAAVDAKGNNHADFDIGGFKLLQVSVATAEIGSKMIFEDDGPSATGTPVTGTVDEDGLTNGIAGGVGDVAGENTVASGSVTGIFQSGADAPLTYSMSSDTSGLPGLSSGGTALVYSVVGNTLTATAGAGGATVFTFSLTSAGAYTFTLLGPLDHPAGNNENDITLNLGSLLKASDKDGDTVTAAAEKLVITIDDDTPNATGTAATGTVDEDGLASGIPGGVGDVAGENTVATGSVTGIFHSGADVPLSYSMSSDTSGLQTLSSGGTTLVYSVVGNTLTATAGVGGATVFTFSLTSTGDYTFTLLKPLDHPAGNNENDININLGTLLQATDKDGDTVTASAEKLVITVDDDTPDATGTAASGTVDEDGLTNGIAGGVGDVAGENTVATGSVTGIFHSGADVPLSYSMSSDTSGLQALNSGGTALVYSVVGNTLTATAGVGGATVFTFSLTSTGDYTFTLLGPLDHPAGNDENDININLGSLLQATDKDGDTVTAAAEKLVITVDDDTPNATGTAATGTVDEDGLANGIAGGVGDVAGENTVATGSVTGIFHSGADVPLTYGLSSDTSGLQALSSGGTALVYSVLNNTLTATAGVGGATVFTFSVTSAGAYTFTLLKPLDHPAGNDENDININLGTLLQATDKDGDTVTAAAEKLVITVDDDTPNATGTAATGTVDEDGLTNGIAGGVGDVAGTATVATGSVTGIFHSGADVPLSYSMSSDTSGLQALNSGGTALVYSVVGNTLTATAGVGGATVFTFSLTSAGDYTFTLLKPLDHPAGNDENDININLGSLLQATDKDGDTVTAAAEKLVITVDDDTPDATGTAATGTVDEDGLANGIAGGVGDVAGTATVATGSVTGIFHSGADVPLSYSMSSDTSGLQALSSGGTALVYSVVGNTLTATAGVGGASVFTFSLTSAGDYTFTLLKPLDHPAGNNENDININLGTLLQATDKDGDTVTAAAEKLVITVDDDTPTAAGTPVTGTVDEDGLSGGIPGGIGDVAGEATVASGSVTGVFQSGADVPLTYGLSSDTSGLQALSSGGTALVYSVLNNTLTAKAGAGGANVFTLSLTAAGAYTFTLLGPLDHASGNNENDLTLNLGTLLQATDKDGDTVTASAEKLVITVDDDTPTLAFGNLIGTGSILPQTGYWDKAYGADGLGATGLDITLVNGQFTLVRPDNTTTTGTGTLTEQSPSPDANGAFHFAGTLTGDFDNNAATANTSVDYTLTAFADGSYTLDLVQGFSSTIVLSSANGSLDAGGPDPVRTLTIGTEHVVFFGANPLAPQTGSNSILTGIGLGAPDPTEAQLQTNPLPSYIGSAAMNVSTSGIGIANNNLEGNNTAGINAGDESFVVNPETLLTAVKVYIDNSLQGYDPATEQLYYTAYYDDGTTSGAPIKVLAADLHAEAGGQTSFTVQTVGSKLIDAVQLTMGLGAVKIPVIEFVKQTESLASDVKLAFNATITDKDGDTASSSFAANLFANDGAGATFQYTLAGTSGARDAFNVDLSRPENTYQVTGFDVTAGHRDAVVLNGDQASTFTIDNSGANSIVAVHETGGQTTTITVVGVDLLNTDIVHGSA